METMESPDETVFAIKMQRPVSLGVGTELDDGARKAAGTISPSTFCSSRGGGPIGRSAFRWSYGCSFLAVRKNSE